MKLIVFALCVSVCYGGRLENTYLPPGSAHSAGGSGNFLAAPYGAAVVKQHHSISPPIPIIKSSNDNQGDGTYQYEYETGNSIQAHESGQLKNAGSEHESLEVHGSYTYTGDDGIQYTVNYIANENGFQPQGAHIPTPPPIPDAILKSIQFNAANPHSEDDGSYHEEAPAAVSRQYLAPNKPSFNSKTGYNY